MIYDLTGFIVLLLQAQCCAAVVKQSNGVLSTSACVKL